jgi:hypothetical protein
MDVRVEDEVVAECLDARDRVHQAEERRRSRLGKFGASRKLAPSGAPLGLPKRTPDGANSAPKGERKRKRTRFEGARGYEGRRGFVALEYWEGCGRAKGLASRTAAFPGSGSASRGKGVLPLALAVFPCHTSLHGGREGVARRSADVLAAREGRNNARTGWIGVVRVRRQPKMDRPGTRQRIKDPYSLTLTSLARTQSPTGLPSAKPGTPLLVLPFVSLALGVRSQSVNTLHIANARKTLFLTSEQQTLFLTFNTKQDATPFVVHG